MNPNKLRVNQLIEIELTEGDETEYLPSRIEEIKEQYLYIAMPMRKGTLLPLSTGQEIKVIMRHKSSTVGFVTKVVGRRREPIPYLIIDKPERIVPVHQKREYVRLNVALPVRFRIIEEGEEAEIEEGLTIDISAGGALFTTKVVVQPEQKMKIEIQLLPKNIISCHAHVVRVFKTDKQDIKVAIEYEDIREVERDKIFKFIFEKQREWIKKGLI
ncbi:MAG TPA: flagellar brake protein [Gelria sp.]|jgi:c-di-GMP-binding flagellar brake protein YcgR|nr:flagellar brake protein [Gelria sp.]